MAHRDIAAADPPSPTPPGVPFDQGSTGDSIPLGRILARGLRVLHRLGSTPEGPLYHAEYPNGTEVALVVLRAEAVGGQPSKREQFDRATQILHPNVAAVYEVGQMEDGSVYVVLEQLAGEPLSNLLAAGHVFPLREALDLALQVAAGLQAAHRARFVHGNLSPHTIVVTPAASGPSRVKLIGFTLDSTFRRRGAQPSIPEGASAGYASPERLTGHPPDQRSDVFSLGAVLHHLLTGRPPDRGQVDRSVPKVARAVLAMALAPAPARRFQKISELDEALKLLASAAADPQSPMIHRALLLGAVGAGLALVTGGIWLFPREVPLEPAPAPSPAAAPPAARQDLPRTRNSPASSDRSPAGASANPAPRATRPQPAATAHAEGEPGRSIETGPPPAEPVVRTGQASTEAPTPVAVERLENRQTEESPDTTEALGYVGEPALFSVPDPPPDSKVVPKARQAAAPPTIRTTARPRSLAELERDQGVRLAIGDVMRTGVAEDVAEIRPGFLRLSLTPAAMHVTSARYNLQRLYLAYSAATRYRDEVTLELRHGKDLYGWFTRDGLKQASSE